MRVLVSGSGGQLAKAIQATWTDCELVMPPEADFNIADRASVQRVVQTCKPDVLVNTAAYTAVDRAETDEAGAMRVNGMAVETLAEACDQANALLVHISTDYVFDGLGRMPYRETDVPSPRSVYGRTKLAGEQAARRAHHHLVVRTAWLYDAWGNNFLNTMLRLGQEKRVLRVVNDQHGSPTTCRALARQLRAAVAGEWRGLLHATCSGETTWYHFAVAIFRMANMQVDISPCLTVDYPTAAERPAYSVLDNSARLALGADVMSSWEAGLAEVLVDRLGLA